MTSNALDLILTAEDGGPFEDEAHAFAAADAVFTSNLHHSVGWAGRFLAAMHDSLGWDPPHVRVEAEDTD